jgi:hypothetical protein
MPLMTVDSAVFVDTPMMGFLYLKLGETLHLDYFNVASICWNAPALLFSDQSARPDRLLDPPRRSACRHAQRYRSICREIRVTHLAASGVIS